jgi:OmpA-OmpF porin, OOP family
MKPLVQPIPFLSLIAALLVSASPGAWAQAPERERVLSGAEATADTLIEALDIGVPGAAAEVQPLSRSFRPAVRARSDDTGGTPGPGRAPLMITFHTGSAELTDESVAVMRQVAAALQSDRLAGFAFVVEGHADPRGGDAINLPLSQSRAEAVVKHLVEQHGVLPQRLQPVGRGSAELYDPARPEAPQNRRVVIVTQRR